MRDVGWGQTQWYDKMRELFKREADMLSYNGRNLTQF
jgi:hypothetical protein